MGRDAREFVFMDVGYTDNPKWFRVLRSMQDAMPDAMPDALLDAMREAMHLHHASIEYCFEHRTDGIFPVRAVKVKAQCRREYAVTALFDVGLWVNLPGGMAEVHDYLRHQRSAAEMEEASEKGRKAARARWGNASSNAPGNASSNAPGNASSNAERRGEEEVKEVRNAADAASRKTPYPPDFETFWSLYPIHRGKGKALQAWKRAVKRASMDTINAGAKRYLDDPNRDDRYTKYAEGWLNGDGWADDPLPTRTPTQAAYNDDEYAWMDIKR